MNTIAIYDIVNGVLGLTRDLIIYMAPLIGVLAGLKFILDYLHKLLFGKKV